MKNVLADIKLEQDEKIELLIRRSPLGYFVIWSGVIVSMLLLALAIVLIPNFAAGLDGGMLFEFNQSAVAYLYLIAMVFLLLVGAGGAIATFVYKNNFLYVTNKRLIHVSTTSLFSSSTNVIDLKSIEDASFSQAGILQHIFRLGTIRMSTVGDETTYTFRYVDTPTDELSQITHLIHKEKNQKK